MASSNSSKSPMLPISDPPPRHDDKAFRGSAMSKRGAYAAISYMSCAVLLVIFNKAALSSYNFPCASVITLLQGFEGVPLNFYTSKIEGEASIPAFLNQIPVIRLVWKIFQKWHFISFNGIIELVNRRIFENLEMYPGKIICSCSFLYALRRWKIISFIVGESSNVNDSSPALVPITTLIHTLPLAVTYLLYMLVTMESVRGVNVPMYTTLRRTTVVFTMFVEYILAGQRYTSSVVGSVGLIVLGAFIAGARDLSFDSYGYAIVFLSNITTAIYLATIARIGKSSGLNSFGLMWCNGIICGPILLFWTFIRGDLGMALNFPHFSSPGFLVVLLLSCILAFFLNYSIFLNTTLNSALTQTICGNLKDIFTIGLGWMIFGGLPFDILNITGQFLGFLGSGLYAYYKLIGK